MKYIPKSAMIISGGVLEKFLCTEIFTSILRLNQMKRQWIACKNGAVKVIHSSINGYIGCCVKLIEYEKPKRNVSIWVDLIRLKYSNFDMNEKDC